MIIDDLNYLEVMSEVPSIVGGDCSLDISTINGRTSVDIEGGRRQTRRNPDGSTTYICRDANGVSSVTLD